MTSIECSGCGTALQLPEGLAEGAAFTCPKCALIARNLESVRRFRWSELEPFVRRHGVSRANFWGGLIGSVAWIPALVVVLLATGKFSIGLLLAVAGPYLVLLALLFQRRGRTPAALWSAHFWVGFGLYFLYLFTIFSMFPTRAGVILDISGMNRSVIVRWMLAVFGASAVVGGLAVAWLYGVRARRLPRATGTAPLALLCAFVALLACCSQPGQPEAGHSPKVFSALPYEQAAAQAKSGGKLLLVDAMASWCPPCKQMDRETWPDADVSAWIADHAIAVQVDVDEEPALAREFRIEAMPTLIVFRDGQELDRRVGGMGPDELLAWLGSVAAR